MDRQKIASEILRLCMQDEPAIPLEQARLRRVKAVNLRLVNSRFQVEGVKPQVPLNKWKTVFRELEEDATVHTSAYSRFILVTDADTDTEILYINKTR